MGKITPSKAPAVIGLQERKEFQETWDFIKNKKSEPQKCIRNFDRGIAFEAEGAEVFASESGAVLKERGLFCMKTDGNYGASPDKTFQGETCKKLFEIKTGKEVKLSGLCLLEIKTQAEGNLKPLTSGAHIAQVQLQEECAEANTCILQSYVPECKKSSYFLIQKNDCFLAYSRSSVMLFSTMNKSSVYLAKI